LTIRPQNGIFNKVMDRTLLLNATFEPLAIVPWKKAVTLLFLEKVEVVKEYDKEIRSVSSRVRLPSVVKLRRFVRNGHVTVRFSRKNIFLRDDYTCQYCGKRFEPKHLTCDHIVPRSRGGVTEWTNIVTSCFRCNFTKGDRLPEEVEMVPLRKPTRPSGFYVLLLNLGIKTLPEYWKDYMFLRD
jgi:5-methylcytosine-specific restriction endonuclease McrA